MRVTHIEEAQSSADELKAKLHEQQTLDFLARYEGLHDWREVPSVPSIYRDPGLWAQIVLILAVCAVVGWLL